MREWEKKIQQQQQRKLSRLYNSKRKLFAIWLGNYLR